jgi:hypothetical protein
MWVPLEILKHYLEVSNERFVSSGTQVYFFALIDLCQLLNFSPGFLSSKETNLSSDYSSTIIPFRIWLRGGRNIPSSVPTPPPLQGSHGVINSSPLGER